MTNQQWLIADRPIGRPLQDSDFKKNVVDIPAPEAEQVLLKMLYFGFDPAQKGWMENNANYVAPTEIGQVMPSSGIAEVIESRHPSFQPGDKVSAQSGWQEYVVLSGDAITKLPDDELLTATLVHLVLRG